MDEYIIINKAALEIRLQELVERRKYYLKQKGDYAFHNLNSINAQIDLLNLVLSESTHLIPEIEKAIQFGKDVRTEKSFINDNYDGPFIDYQDSTEETNDYIANLKLGI